MIRGSACELQKEDFGHESFPFSMSSVAWVGLASAVVPIASKVRLTTPRLAAQPFLSGTVAKHARAAARRWPVSATSHLSQTRRTASSMTSSVMSPLLHISLRGDVTVVGTHDKSEHARSRQR